MNNQYIDAKECVRCEREAPLNDAGYCVVCHDWRQERGRA